jgi:hypothetical protein
MWRAQPGPQANAMSATWCPELFFGGARGGGKSDYLLADYAQDVNTYGKHWQGILFRRSYVELQELIKRSKEIYGTAAQWHEQAKEQRFANGAVLKFRYLERLDDYMMYQGHAYPWQGYDELTQWPDLQHYFAMKGCLRSGGAEIPTKRMRSSGNPGGPGHTAVKEYFIDHHPKGYVPYDDPVTNMARMYIPSRVYDNKILLQRDPEYVQRLRGVGSPELVRAWLEGDWTVVIGGYFPEFSDAHIVRPFKIPRHWHKYCGFDWGSHSPFCAVWGAVSTGKNDEGQEVSYSKGALVIYREAYEKGRNNDEIGDILRSIEIEEVQQRFADPSIFKHDGGPSIAEQIGVHFYPGDNARIAGWQELRNRLQADPPMIYIFETARNLLRTIPLMQHDRKRPEDLDTEMEDHAVDALRYLCMGRPYAQVEAANRQEVARHGRINLHTYIDDAKRARANESRI